MPTMPQDYYDRFNADKNYEKILHRDGYTLQGAELNEAQSASMHRLRGIADALFKDGDIIRDAQISVDAATGAVRAGSGAIYLCGAVRGVPDAEFTIPTAGTVAIGVRLVEKVISELEDKSLYNPVIGSRGEGEPGAWRLQINATWGFDGDGGDGEFYPVYTVDDGELRPKEAPPTLDTFTQSIARYDRDSTAGGSYIVTGLTVLKAAQYDEVADGNQVYTVAEGRARVNGYGVELPTSRRISHSAVPDLRLIDTEIHIADGSSKQRLNLAHTPLFAVKALRITRRKVVTLTHGSYSGCADALPDTSVVNIVECRQNSTVFTQGTDYRKNGDTVDWSPSGAEPATGSTYSVTYDCILAVDPLNKDEDGFSVEGAVSGSNIMVTYEQALPRLDRLCLTQDGQFQWIMGVASELNARSPVVPSALLPIATVKQTWRDNREVENDGTRVSSFSEIETINRRIDYVLQEVSRQRLEADVFTRESGARVGLFVDPLLNDDMRDQGLTQTAAIVSGALTLPIDALALNLSTDLDKPAGAAYTPSVLLEQPFRTGSMKVNPYDAFEPLPARCSITPALDRWTETQTKWASSVTQRFDTGHIVWGVSWVGSQSTSSRTENLGSVSSSLEYLRQLNINYRVEGFGAGEKLVSATFDGLPLSISGTANEEGVLTGTFTIPAKVPAGAKNVVFTGKGGSWGSAVFVGQGTLTVTTMRQINTVSTYWVDPLAQTFSPGKDVQMCGCDLWFTAAGGDARVQIREVQTGMPTRVILAEAFVPKATMLLKGVTRVLFPSPVPLSANGEYALVVLCDDAVTSVAVAELGKFDSTAQRWITSQPYQVGVLLSSSNASTWTAHQDRDLTFRLLEAKFTPGTHTVNLGQATLAAATDLVLLALDETPTARTRVEYELTLPGGATHTVAPGQVLRLAQPVSGKAGVKAKLTGEAAASPLLWPGTQLIQGKVKATADYYSRSIPAIGASKAVLIYDAVIPSGASVKPEIRINAGNWQALTADGTTNQGDGLVEYRWKIALSNANEIKVRFTLTGTSPARPYVGNIRFMAVL